jgi:2-polyprenyl-6-hydroxyphenyl methylase/3-demethylubiquinone-9 3-methyltransferase
MGQRDHIGRMRAKSPDSTAVRAYFDTEAEDYVRNREAQYSFACQKRLVLEMLEDAAGSTSGRLLDVGCGPGVMEEALAARGFEVRGIDVSARMIEQGKARLAARGLTRCSLEVGDVTQLGGAGGFYDAVLAMGVLEYLPDYRAALSEMHRVLRSGGVLVLTVPNRFSPYHAGRRAYAALRALAGKPPADTLAINACAPAQLDRLLAAHGFRKLESRGCNFILFPVHHRLPKASEALNRALWPLARTLLGRFLGAQYVVKARKR